MLLVEFYVIMELKGAYSDIHSLIIKNKIKHIKILVPEVESYEKALYAKWIAQNLCSLEEISENPSWKK